jgi:TRAP-type C4-dicarboxylate transport system substrate-binding protein
MVEETGGKVVPRVQNMNELGLKGPETWRMAKLGVAEMVNAAMGYSSGDVPENDGMDIAGLALDLKTLRESVNAYQPSLKELYRERAGIELVGIWPLAAQVIWCAVPINGLADMRGKKTRVSGAAPAEFIEAIGGVPTTISFPEVVPSLQRKVIDCAVTGTVAGNVAKWTEVTTHLYPLVIGWGLEGIYVNKKWWDGLNPKARTFLQARADELVELGWQQADVGTNNGIWCTTGDDRCNPDAVVPIPLDKLNHTLVPVTEADKKARLKLVEKAALPKFAARCGKACIDNWNKTVGKVYGVTAKMP